MMTGDSKLVKAAGARPKPPNAGKGRTAGVPNKTTAAVKEAMLAVYADLQAKAAKDMEDAPENAHFLAWAEGNPTEFYKLWVKLLPTEISGPNGGAIPLYGLTDKLAALPKDRRDALRAAVLAAMEGQPA